jgi:hypothetical protein
MRGRKTKEAKRRKKQVEITNKTKEAKDLSAEHPEAVAR